MEETHFPSQIKMSISPILEAKPELISSSNQPEWVSILNFPQFFPQAIVVVQISHLEKNEEKQKQRTDPLEKLTGPMDNTGMTSHSKGVI